MKLRLRGNSIRLRLTRSEVERLGSDGSVRECVELGEGSRFEYELSISDVDALAAKFGDGCLTVRISTENASKLTSTEQVGVEAELPSSGGKIRRIVVEKDFACLKERATGEDADAFPNPFYENKC